MRRSGRVEAYLSQHWCNRTGSRINVCVCELNVQLSIRVCILSIQSIPSKGSLAGSIPLSGQGTVISSNGSLEWHYMSSRPQKRLKVSSEDVLLLCQYGLACPRKAYFCPVGTAGGN